MKPGEPLSYVAMGRNAKMQGHNEDAVALFDKAIELQNDYSAAYAFRAESYISLGRFEVAAADVVTSLSIDGGDKAFQHMRELADSSCATMVSRLKVQLKVEPNNPYWSYCLGVVLEDGGRYKAAIDIYRQAIAKDKDADLDEVLIIDPNPPFTREESEKRSNMSKLTDFYAHREAINEQDPRLESMVVIYL